MSLHLILRRFPVPSPEGMFGRLLVLVDDEVVYRCVTVERPWADNMANVSCIPPGIAGGTVAYELRLDKYNRGGYEAWELRGVNARTEIKIHKGNTAEHVQGCIAVGTRFGRLGSWAVSSSRAAFAGLMEATAGFTSGTVKVEYERS